MRLDQVVVRKSDSQFEVLTPWASWPTMAGCLAALLVAMPMLLGGDPVLIAMGVGIGVFSGFMLRELRRSGVRVTASAVVGRGDFRRRHWDTEKVERFSVGTRARLVPWQSLWLELETSERQPLEQVRVWGRGTEGRECLERAADDANDWLRALRAGRRQ